MKRLLDLIGFVLIVSLFFTVFLILWNHSIHNHHLLYNQKESDENERYIFIIIYRSSPLLLYQLQVFDLTLTLNIDGGGRGMSSVL